MRSRRSSRWTPSVVTSTPSSREWPRLPTSAECPVVRTESAGEWKPAKRLSLPWKPTMWLLDMVSLTPADWHACPSTSASVTSWLLLLWPQSSCPSSWSPCPQVRRQDGDKQQPGVGHRGDQRGGRRTADRQLWENGDRHHAGERHPAGVDAVTPALRPITPSRPTPHLCSSSWVPLRFFWRLSVKSLKWYFWQSAASGFKPHLKF